MGKSKYFILKNDSCNLVVGIEGNKDSEQSLVVMCTFDASNLHQFWYEDSDTGTIRSKANNLCLTASEGGTNRIRLGAYRKDDPKQQWMVSGDRVLNRRDRNKVLDIADGCQERGAQLCSWEKHSDWNQLWNVQYFQRFYLESKLNGMVVDVADNNPNPNAKVIMWEKHQTHEDNQLWFVDQAGFLRSSLNHFAPDGSVREITMQPFEASKPNRRWVVEKISDTTVVVALKEKRNGKQIVFDILDFNKNLKAPVGAFESNNGDNQKWHQSFVDK